MAQSKRFLVIVDPTVEAQPGLERAVWLAQRCGAAVELFICDYDQYLAGERFCDAESLQAARNAVIDAHLKRLGTLAQSLQARGVTPTVDARWDHPLHEGILRKVEAFEPDLVVKDTHYHSAIKRSIFSNTDWNLIRSCPVALLLVKPRPIAATPRIIAAVDPLHQHDKPAELDKLILTRAEELCVATQGDLHVFHAYDPAIAVAASTTVVPVSVSVDELTREVAQRHREAFAELMSERAHQDFEQHIHRGTPQKLLVALANHLQADFVVMGAVSRSALKRAFIGSTAERVLDHVSCDVLVVNPEGSRRRFGT